MKYLSTCSGIEAASQAFAPLGWAPLLFSEIEAFPRAVLAHHYTDVPLYGDFRDLIGDPVTVEADLLCGGTPCQDFSIAGRRAGLAGLRGTLTMDFVRLADAIDDLRLAPGRGPAWVLFENVPGILSIDDGAGFAAFLGTLCGADAAIDHSGSWPRAGVVAGPRRTAAWRVLDARYFGLAQRRERVFVLARGGAGGWACADALLPIGESLRRHPAPGREARKGAPRAADAGAGGCRELAGTLNANGKAAGSSPSQDAESGLLIAFGGNNTSGPIDVATTRTASHTASHTASGRQDFESETFIVSDPLVFNARQDPISGPLVGPLDTDGASQAIAFALRGRQGGAMPEVHDDVSALRAASGGSSRDYIAFTSKDHGADATDDLSPTMRAGGHADSHANAGVPPAVAGAMGVRRITPTEAERLQGFPDGFTNIPWRGKPHAPDGPRYRAIGNSWAVPCVAWIGRQIERVRQ